MPCLLTAAPSFHSEMALKFLKLSMLSKLIIDDQPMLDRRLLPGGADESADRVGSDDGASAHPLVCDSSYCANRAQRAELEEAWVCVMRQPWTLLRTVMTQGGWGAQAMPMGTTVPSCMSHDDRALSAAFARFGASRAEKNALLRVPSFARKSLVSC